jgi:hypothetical protein
MGDVATESMTDEMDIWLRIVNGNPLLFYGVVVTGGVAIILILCLILVCLSLAYRSQRHSEFRSCIDKSNLIILRFDRVYT